MKTSTINNISQPIVPPLHDFIFEKYTVIPEATLTVDEIKIILEYWNGKNRAINENNVQNIYDDVMGNKYLQTGLPLRFSWEGHIADLQHTLIAHVKANKPFTGTIIGGIDPKAFMYIDGGKSRGNGLRVEIAKGKEISSSQVSKNDKEIAIAKFIYRAENDFKNGFNNPNLNKKLEIVNANKESIDFLLQPCWDKLTKKAGYRAAICVYWKKDKIKAQEFHKLVGGDGLNIASAAVGMLRKELIGSKGGGGFVQNENYGKTVAMIHSFHLGTPPKKNSIETKWAF